MRRKTNTKYIQLEFDFTYDDVRLTPDVQNEQEVIRRIDVVVKKYLGLVDKSMGIWEKLFEDKNTPKKLWRSFRKYQKNMKLAANRMISRISNRNMVSFRELEWDIVDKDTEDGRYARTMLDAYGFIQQEYDLAHGHTDFGIIGYHYFLAEDGVSSLILPQSYLKHYSDKYREKYEQFRQSKQSV